MTAPTAPTTLPTTEFVGLNVDGRTYAAVEHVTGIDLRRASAKGETFSRLSSTLAAVQPITAQAVYTAIELAAGDVVTSIVYTTNTTAGATLTHTSAALYSAALGKLAVSADNVATSLAASTEFTFTLTAPFTIPSDGLYYLGFASVGTTVATMSGVTGIATVNARTPVVAFTDTTATIGAPSTYPTTATVSAGFSGLYAYVV